ncbi:MAG: hypothetical protein LQ343_004322 [Gyalolechia ehrenbergii]|nr:MAG: hypothetical protein LQ343_004322 [Gyalolechia ehrenbergii]
MSFSSIPVLDISLAQSPDTKSSFLESLRHALLQVGFLYIKNIGISDALMEDVIVQGKAFFDLPEEKKMEVQMKNAQSFLGYNKLGNEITAFNTDWRVLFHEESLKIGAQQLAQARTNRPIDFASATKAIRSHLQQSAVAKPMA